MKVASSAATVSFTYTLPNGKQKTKVVDANTPNSKPKETDSDSSSTTESSTSSTTESSASSTTESSASSTTSTSTQAAESEGVSDQGSISDTERRYQILINLVFNGQRLTAGETEDGIQFAAGDHTVELSKEDLLQNSELRQLVRQKIAEQLSSSATDLSGFTQYFSSIFKPKNEKQNPRLGADPASFIDLALAKFLSQQRLDVEA